MTAPNSPDGSMKWTRREAWRGRAFYVVARTWASRHRHPPRRGAGSERAGARVSAALSGSDVLSLLPVQRAMWLDQRLAVRDAAYNTGELVLIDADLDRQFFEAAVTRAVAEADALRMRFRLVDGDMVQQPGPAGPVALHYVDLSTDADPRRAALQWFRAALQVPIGVDAEALFRFALLRLGPAEWAWARVFNHLVTDAHGRAALTAAVAAHYAGRPAPAAAPFARALEVLDAHAAALRHQASRAYWEARLADLAPLLFAASMGDGIRGAREVMAVSSAQAAMLRTRAAAAGVSFARLLTAITGRAILRAFDREALLLGVLVDLRPGAAFDATVGCFATALPLPFAAPAGATLEETARSLSAGLMRAYRSRPYPGRITVLRSSCQPLLRLRGDASLGWAALAEGGVEVRGIPGNHQSLMWAPQVAALGAVLCDVLDVPPIHRKDPRSSLPRLLPVSSARSRRRSPPNP